HTRSPRRWCPPIIELEGVFPREVGTAARSTRTWIVAGLTAAAVIVAIVVHQLGDSGERQPLAQPAPEVHQERSVVTDEVADGAPDELTASAQSSPPCAGQQLEVTLNDSTESVCMGTLVTRYNGS